MIWIDLATNSWLLRGAVMAPWKLISPVSLDRWIRVISLDRYHDHWSPFSVQIFGRIIWEKTAWVTKCQLGMLQVQRNASTDNAQTMAICEVQRRRITGRHATSKLIASWPSWKILVKLDHFPKGINLKKWNHHLVLYCPSTLYLLRDAFVEGTVSIAFAQLMLWTWTSNEVCFPLIRGRGALSEQLDVYMFCMMHLQISILIATYVMFASLYKIGLWKSHLYLWTLHPLNDLFIIVFVRQQLHASLEVIFGKHEKNMWNIFPSWWFQPHLKNSQIGSSPQEGMKIKSFEATT